MGPATTPGVSSDRSALTVPVRKGASHAEHRGCVHPRLRARRLRLRTDAARSPSRCRMQGQELESIVSYGTHRPRWRNARWNGAQCVVLCRWCADQGGRAESGFNGRPAHLLPERKCHANDARPLSAADYHEHRPLHEDRAVRHCRQNALRESVGRRRTCDQFSEGGCALSTTTSLNGPLPGTTRSPHCS